MNDRKTAERPKRELPKLVQVYDKDGRGYVSQLYEHVGPSAGLGVLKWSIVGPGYETIENPPETDVIIVLSDGDFVKVCVDNPEDISDVSDSGARASNNNQLRWSLTNVAMQAQLGGPVGIELPSDTISRSTPLVVGQPLILRSQEWQNALQTPGQITQVLVYNRTRELDDSSRGQCLESTVLTHFRAAIARQKIAVAAVNGI